MWKNESSLESIDWKKNPSSLRAAQIHRCIRAVQVMLKEYRLSDHEFGPTVRPQHFRSTVWVSAEPRLSSGRRHIGRVRHSNTP